MKEISVLGNEHLQAVKDSIFFGDKVRPQCERDKCELQETAISNRMLELLERMKEWKQSINDSIRVSDASVD